jgi:hypothetical protein
LPLIIYEQTNRKISSPTVLSSTQTFKKKLHITKNILAAQYLQQNNCNISEEAYSE